MDWVDGMDTLDRQLEPAQLFVMRQVKPLEVCLGPQSPQDPCASNTHHATVVDKSAGRLLCDSAGLSLIA